MHTNCINGHDMWDGNGEPSVYIYNLTVLTEQLKKHPEAMYFQGIIPKKTKREDWPEKYIFDVVNNLVDCDELDGWFCDECNTLCVYDYSIRYDYDMDEITNESNLLNYSKWDTYIAPRDEEYGEFLELETSLAESKDKITLDRALEQFKFKYYYRVSDDLKHIYAFNTEGKYCFAMKQIRIL